MERSNESMPPVYVLEGELEQLTALVDSDAEERFPAETGALRSELDRAIVVRAEGLPKDVVTMHSTVDYLDVGSGRRACVTLVYPWEADSARARISILAPLATALLGLRAGASITWKTPAGRHHTWQVLAVRGSDGQ